MNKTKIDECVKSRGRRAPLNEIAKLIKSSRFYLAGSCLNKDEPNDFDVFPFDVDFDFNDITKMAEENKMLTSEDLVEDLKEERDRLIQTVKHLEQQLDLREQKIKTLEHEIELCMIQISIATNEQQKKQQNRDKLSAPPQPDTSQSDANPDDIARLEKLLEESLGFYVQLQKTTSDITKALLFEAIQQNDRILRNEMQRLVVGPDSKKIYSLLQKANVIMQCSKKVSGQI